jgi:hypothetical protein
VSVRRTVVAIAGVATWIQKLRVIKRIEQFSAELHVGTLSDRCVFVEGQGPILDSRSAANSSWGIAQLTDWHSGVGKSVGIKVLTPILARVHAMKGLDLIWLARVFEGEDISEQVAI